MDFDFRKVKQDKDNKTNLDPKNLASDDTCQPRSPTAARRLALAAVIKTSWAFWDCWTRSIRTCARTCAGNGRSRILIARREGVWASSSRCPTTSRHRISSSGRSRCNSWTPRSRLTLTSPGRTLSSSPRRSYQIRIRTLAVAITRQPRFRMITVHARSRTDTSVDRMSDLPMVVSRHGGRRRRSTWMTVRRRMPPPPSLGGQAFRRHDCDGARLRG